ncbi:hypothetical protein GGR58DRAFT_482456 [Xylaria digitata]|nr:hypothetical protein GGR58DRAFT_482456 [Xylaria digitata]
MEPPSKRLRLDPSLHADDDEENQDELSMTPAQFDSTQDPMYRFDKGRTKAATKLKSSFEDIFSKYGKHFDGDDDIVNFYTEEIEVNNGHLLSLEDRDDDDSLSNGEEEKNIMNRKSSDKKKKSPSKSLILSNHAGPNQRLHFNSLWNGQPGLNTHRLSSLAFSSSLYGSPPPFDFGPSAFGNGHIDPVWQAPDLPTHPPYHQHGSLIGIGGSQSSSFDDPSSHVAKRLVSAKSFLLRAALTDGGETDEEDDILLGRNNQDKVCNSSSKGRVKAPIAGTPGSNSRRSSRSPDEQPPFNGNALAEDEPSTKLVKATIQTIATESSMTKVVLPPPQLANADPQHPQKARNSHSLSPARRKRGRLRKSDARESTNTFNEEVNPETHPLQPNIRRIEIIIPIMKRLLPTDIEATEGTTLVTDETLQPPDEDQMASTSKDIEIRLLEDDLHTSQSTSSHADGVHYPSTDIVKDLQVVCDAIMAEDPNHAANPSNTEELRRGRPKRTREHPDLSSTNISLHDEKAGENMFIGVSQESKSSQTVTESFTDDNRIDSLHRTGQKSDGDSESDRIAPSQQASPNSEVGMGEEQAVSNTSVEGNAETVQVEKQGPEETPAQSVSLTKIPCDSAADGVTEMSDFPTTEAMVTALSESQKEPQDSHHENEDLLQNELDPSLIGIDGEELLPVHSPAPDSAAAQEAAVGSSEVADAYEARISVPKRDIGYQSPEHSAIRETTKSDIWHGRDSLFPTPEASGIRKDQERNLLDESLSDSVLIAEIDGLQLYSDCQYAQRSPSLGAMEFPDPDLSDVPIVPDAHAITESVLRLLSHPTESDSQRTSGEGRSPSPELGTPIGTEITRETASRTKDSLAPTTPTRKQSSKSAKPRSSYRRTPSSKRFPLTSLIPGGVDDDSDDELSMAGSFSGASSRLHSPFFRANNNGNPDLPPLLPTPRKKTQKHRLLTSSPPSSTRTPNRIFGVGGSRNTPPATESRVGRSQTRRGRNRAVHSSPLARRVAERLLSSPIKKHHATPLRSPSVVASPHGTLRRCGEDGFVCDRDFCLTCCI